MVEVSSTIQCKLRQTDGKGGAHKLRGTGMIPVVAYGPGSEPRHLSVDPKVFMLQRQSFGTSYIYDVAVEGGDRFKALIKDTQYDPITRKPLHVDLYAVDMTKPIRVDVPVELTGKPAGAIEGGVLTQLLRRVEVQCLPDKVPSKISVDVSALTLGGVMHASALPLPEGVTLITRREDPIASVVKPEEEIVAAPVAVEGAEGAVPTPAEGEAAAAPAAAEGEAAKGAKPEAAKGGKPEAAGKGGKEK